jgi:hypothetical protein
MFGIGSGADLIEEKIELIHGIGTLQTQGNRAGGVIDGLPVPEGFDLA